MDHFMMPYEPKQGFLRTWNAAATKRLMLIGKKHPPGP